MPAFGLDFGTTNSAVARCTAGPPELARFSGESTFRSILFFDPEERGSRGELRPLTGPEALRRYIEVGSEGRLMQSIKSHLASRSLVGTSVFGRQVTVEEFVARLLRDIREQVEAQWGPLDGPVVVGRPVRYVGSRSCGDDDYAVGRTREALRLAGWSDVSFEYEPVAAAFHHEQALQQDEVLLIADFGGGTADYCLMRAGPSFRGGRNRQERILGTGGVGVAGDHFDGRVLEQRVAPALGRGLTWRSPFGRDIEVPRWYYQHLVRWHRLSMLQTPKNMRDLRRFAELAEDAEPIEAFLHLIEHNLGFALAGAVEGAKIELSGSEHTRLRFVDPPVRLDEPLDRATFEAWIAGDLEALAQALDETLEKAGVAAESVDGVFLTGGSARVPAVQALFDQRFGADRVHSGDHLTSVASGLALIARELAP